MNDRNELLKAIRSRSSADRYGIATADAYLASMSSCFNGGPCPSGMGGVSQSEWEGALKDASQKFTFCEKGMNIDSKTISDSHEPGFLLEFDCCVTSTRKDRDGDVLVTSGAVLDPAAPLLWAHSPFHPIGRLIRRTGQTPTKLTARCGILDFGNSSGELATMARDAAVLIKGGALRISHGFDPEDFEALDEKDGRFKINKYTILEISVVAIPSNVDAIITNFSSGKLHNPVIQKWAKTFYDSRPVQGTGFTASPAYTVGGWQPQSGMIVSGSAIGNGIVAKESANLRSKGCGGDCGCDDCRKSAEAKDSVRHEGESVQDCVSRKIQILEHEGGRSHEQIQAIAYSMCREGKSKEQAIADLEKLAELFAKKPTEKPMNAENKPAVETKVASSGSEIPISGAAPQGGVAPPVESRDQDRENFLGQGPQAGDRDWPERHMPEQVVDQNMPGVSDFNVGNTADDSIMAIATGPMTGSQRNPAHDTQLADTPGTEGQPPPSPVGVHYPIETPVNPSLNPPAQGGRPEPSLSSSVQGPKGTTTTVKEQSPNVRTDVQPLDSDSAMHHDTDGNVNPDVIVDAPHLKSVAGMIQHSGKAGHVYVNEGKGHVHHVAHPDDLHPANSHMYHTHDEIQKLYKSVSGVKGCKVAIMEHPIKGAGYKMVHKPGADPGMGDGLSHVNHRPVNKDFIGIKGRLEHVIHEKSGKIPDQAKKILADAYVLLMKFSSLDPTGYGMSAGLPEENALNQESLGNFTGVPADNSLNQSSMTGFQGQQSPGTPPENQLNRPSMDHFGQPMQQNTPAVNPPKALNPNEGRRTDPGTMWNESVDGPNIPGSIAQRGNMLSDEDVMNWLEEVPKSHDEDIDKEFEALLVQEMFS